MPAQSTADVAPRREPFNDVSAAQFMENFAAHGQRPADGLLGDAHDMRVASVKDCMDLVNSVRRIYKNPTLNSVQQDIEVGKLLQPQVVQKAKMFEAWGRRVMERWSDVANEVDVKLRPTNNYDSAVAAEIRSYFRSLPDDKRSDGIASALAGNNTLPVYRAIASAPGFLSGLTDARHAQLRTECLGLVAPEYVGMEAALLAEAQRMRTAAEAVRRIFGKRFDFDRAAELAKLAQG